MLHATARVLKYCGALGTCAALAVCTAYVTSAAQSVREGQPQAGAVAKSRDDLAGKLSRREVQRSPLSIPDREIGAGGDVDSGGSRVRMARSSRRRGRLHHRRPGRDDGTGTCHRSTARRGSIPHPPRTPHNARDLGPETGRMLSTYIVETGQPIATFVDQPVQR